MFHANYDAALAPDFQLASALLNLKTAVYRRERTQRAQRKGDETNGWFTLGKWTSRSQLLFSLRSVRSFAAHLLFSGSNNEGGSNQPF